LIYVFELVKIDSVTGIIKATGELSKKMTILPLTKALVMISGELVLKT